MKLCPKCEVRRNGGEGGLRAVALTRLFTKMTEHSPALAGLPFQLWDASLGRWREGLISLRDALPWSETIKLWFENLSNGLYECTYWDAGSSSLRVSKVTQPQSTWTWTEVLLLGTVSCDWVLRGSSQRGHTVEFCISLCNSYRYSSSPQSLHVRGGITKTEVSSLSKLSQEGRKNHTPDRLLIFSVRDHRSWTVCAPG